MEESNLLCSMLLRKNALKREMRMEVESKNYVLWKNSRKPGRTFLEVQWFKTLHFQHGGWGSILVGELRSQMLCNRAKYNKRERGKNREMSLRAHKSCLQISEELSAPSSGVLPSQPMEMSDLLTSPWEGQSSRWSLLCYTVWSHQLSVLYAVSIVYMCRSQSPNTSHPLLSPLVSICLFSTSVSVFLLCK